MKPRVLIEITKGDASTTRGFWAWLDDLDRPYYFGEVRSIARHLVRYGRVYVCAADAKIFKDLAQCAGYWTTLEESSLTFREERV